MHFIISMAKRVVRRVPSSRRGPASMVMAWAGQIASHSLQAMQRSSPFGYASSIDQSKPATAPAGRRPVVLPLAIERACQMFTAQQYRAKAAEFRAFLTDTERSPKETSEF